MTTIVFLHIPKTAGQTIHRELARIVGPDAVSPIRVHTQAAAGGDHAQMPGNYRLYSGHIDWAGLEALPADRFAFTVLRDPLERIGSFYFYLLEQARRLTPTQLQMPAHAGMRMICTRSADDYFFGGDAAWTRFIHDHYDNFYCSYLATRKVRGWSDLIGLHPAERLTRAQAGARALDRVYSCSGLGALEADIKARCGTAIRVVDRYVNAGPQASGALRWPSLCARFERDVTAARVERFADLDHRLMARLGLGAPHAA